MLQCARTGAHKANLREEAALFGSRWEYFQLKKILVMHHTYAESAASQHGNSEHVLNEVCIRAPSGEGTWLILDSEGTEEGGAPSEGIRTIS